MAKFHWLRFELLDGGVELNRLLSQETILGQPKDFYSISFFNPTISRTPSLEDVVHSVVSPSAPKKERILYARSPRAGCAQENYPAKNVHFHIIYSLHFAFCPLCKDLDNHKTSPEAQWTHQPINQEGASAHLMTPRQHRTRPSRKSVHRMFLYAVTLYAITFVPRIWC